MGALFEKRGSQTRSKLFKELFCPLTVLPVQAGESRAHLRNDKKRRKSNRKLTKGKRRLLAFFRFFAIILHRKAQTMRPEITAPPFGAAYGGNYDNGSENSKAPPRARHDAGRSRRRARRTPSAIMRLPPYPSAKPFRRAALSITSIWQCPKCRRFPGSAITKAACLSREKPPSPAR